MFFHIQFDFAVSFVKVADVVAQRLRRTVLQCWWRMSRDGMLGVSAGCMVFTFHAVADVDGNAKEVERLGPSDRIMLYLWSNSKSLCLTADGVSRVAGPFFGKKKSPQGLLICKIAARREWEFEVDSNLLSCISFRKMCCIWRRFLVVRQKFVQATKWGPVEAQQQAVTGPRYRH